MEAAAIVNIIEVWMKVVILYCIKSVFAAVHMQSSLCFQGKWTLLILVLKVPSCAAAGGRGHETGKVFWPAAALTSYNTVTSVSGTTFYS